MTEHHRRRVQLVVEIDRELQDQIERTAALHTLSVNDYVASVLHEAVLDSQTENGGGGSGVWATLSAPAFARDWESPEDRVYDDLSER
jgi:hypothetical protein